MYGRDTSFSVWGAGVTDVWQGAQAGDILVAARTHLNDDEGIIWPDQKLFPKLREAHRQLQLALVANGVPIISEVSATFSVPAGTKDMSTLPNYPSNMIQPVWLKERGAGQRDVDFIDMVETDFLPQVQPDRRITWWTWQKQKLLANPSNQNVEVMVRFKRSLLIPQAATDEVGPYFSEIFLSYKTAALAVGSITPRDADKLAYLEMQARDSLEDVLKLAATSAQSLPTKRRPYHRGRMRMAR